MKPFKPVLTKKKSSSARTTNVPEINTSTSINTETEFSSSMDIDITATVQPPARTRPNTLTDLINTYENSGIDIRKAMVGQEEFTADLDKIYDETILEIEEVYCNAQKKCALTHHKNMRGFPDEVMNQGLLKKDYTVPFLVDIKGIMKEFRYKKLPMVTGESNINANEVSGDKSSWHGGVASPSDKFCVPVKKELKFLDEPYPEFLDTVETSRELKAFAASATSHLALWRKNVLKLAVEIKMPTKSLSSQNSDSELKVSTSTVLTSPVLVNKKTPIISVLPISDSDSEQKVSTPTVLTSPVLDNKKTPIISVVPISDSDSEQKVSTPTVLTNPVLDNKNTPIISVVPISDSDSEQKVSTPTVFKSPVLDNKNTPIISLVPISDSDSEQKVSTPTVFKSPVIDNKKTPIVSLIPISDSDSEQKVSASTVSKSPIIDNKKTPVISLVPISPEKFLTQTQSEEMTDLTTSEASFSKTSEVNKTSEIQIDNSIKNNSEVLNQSSPPIDKDNSESFLNCTTVEEKGVPPKIMSIKIFKYDTNSRSAREIEPGSRLVALATQRPTPNVDKSDDPKNDTVSLNPETTIRPVRKYEFKKDKYVPHKESPFKSFAPLKRKLDTPIPDENVVVTPSEKVPRIDSVSGATKTTPRKILPAPQSSFIAVNVPINSNTISQKVVTPSTSASLISTSTISETSTNSSTCPTVTVPSTSRSGPSSSGSGVTILPAVPKNLRSQIIKTEIDRDADLPMIEQVFCNSSNNNTIPRMASQLTLTQLPKIKTVTLDSIPMQKPHPVVLPVQPQFHQTQLINGKHTISVSLVRPPVPSSSRNSAPGALKTYSSLCRPKQPQAQSQSVEKHSEDGVKYFVRPAVPVTQQSRTSAPSAGSSRHNSQSAQVNTFSNEQNFSNICKQIEAAETENRLKKLKEAAVVAERAKYPEIRIIQGEEFMVCRICMRSFRRGGENLYRAHMLKKHFIDLGNNYPKEENADSEDEEYGVDTSSWFKCPKCRVMMQTNLEQHRRNCRVNEGDEDDRTETRYDRVQVQLLNRRRNDFPTRLGCGLCITRGGEGNDKYFDTPVSLRQHLCASHADVASKILLLPAFRCGTCLEKFEDTLDLTRHGAICTARPTEKTILELADSLRHCEVCTTTHSSIDETARCYKEMGIDRCVICMHGKSIRGNFSSHMSKYHCRTSSGSTCPFCDGERVDGLPEYYTIKALFEHIIKNHYVPLLHRRQRKRAAQQGHTRQQQPPPVKLQPSPSPAKVQPPPPPPPVKVQTISEVLNEELRYQAVLQSKRPLKPKPIQYLKIPTKATSTITMPPRNSQSSTNIDTGGVTITPVSVGTSRIVERNSTTQQQFNSNPNIIPVDLNSILGI